MRPIRYFAIALLGLVCIGAGCGSSAPVGYQCAAGKYTVQVSGTPVETSKPLPGTTIYINCWEADDGKFVVMFNDFPPETARMIAADLATVCNAAMRSAGGKATGSKPIQLQDKYPGYEIEGREPQFGGKIRVRVYQVQNRFYQVLAAGKKLWADSPATTEFLDSFHVTD